MDGCHSAAVAPEGCLRRQALQPQQPLCVQLRNRLARGQAHVLAHGRGAAHLAGGGQQHRHAPMCLRGCVWGAGVQVGVFKECVTGLRAPAQVQRPGTACMHSGSHCTPWQALPRSSTTSAQHMPASQPCTAVPCSCRARASRCAAALLPSSCPPPPPRCQPPPLGAAQTLS